MSDVDLDRGPFWFGGAGIGNLLREVSDDDARATVDAAWDVGVRGFDTPRTTASGERAAARGGARRTAAGRVRDLDEGRAAARARAGRRGRRRRLRGAERPRPAVGPDRRRGPSVARRVPRPARPRPGRHRVPARPRRVRPGGRADPGAAGARRAAGRGRGPGGRRRVELGGCADGRRRDRAVRRRHAGRAVHTARTTRRRAGRPVRGARCGRRRGRGLQLRLLSRPLPAPDTTYDYARPRPSWSSGRGRSPRLPVCGRHGVTLPETAVAFPLRAHQRCGRSRSAAQSAELVRRTPSVPAVLVPAALWDELRSIGLLAD